MKVEGIGSSLLLTGLDLRLGGTSDLLLLSLDFLGHLSADSFLCDMTVLVNILVINITEKRTEKKFLDARNLLRG